MYHGLCPGHKCIALHFIVAALKKTCKKEKQKQKKQQIIVFVELKRASSNAE